MGAFRSKFVRLFGNLWVWDVGRAGRWITGKGLAHYSQEVMVESECGNPPTPQGWKACFVADS